MDLNLLLFLCIQGLSFWKQSARKIYAIPTGKMKRGRAEPSNLSSSDDDLDFVPKRIKKGSINHATAEDVRGNAMIDIVICTFLVSGKL